MTRPKRTPEERLAGEAEHVARRTSVATWSALAVALVALGNLVAARLTDPPWLSPDRRIIGTKFEVLADRAAEVVVLGDSSATFGVDATLLGEVLGRPASNLATFGRFEVAGSAWTLDEYVARHGAPRLVVAVHGARTWWLEASGYDLAQLPLEVGYWRRRAPTRSLPARALGEFALARYAPLFTQSLAFARGLRGGPFAVPDEPPIAADGTVLIGEAQARWANPEAFLERTIRPELAARAPGVPTRQRAAVEALAARADAEGFDLVFVSAPHWDALTGIPEHVAVLAESEALLAEVAARSPRVHLLPGGPRTFPREDVENPYHLRAEAAQRYTRALAADLRALVAGL